MTCRKYEEFFLEHGDGSLTADLTAHLAVCDECRKAREGTLWAARMAGLKRYEHPDSAFAARSLVRINQAIDELEARPRGWLGRFLEFWSQERLPILRYAVAMVLLAFVGLSIFPARHMTSLESQTIQPLRLAPAAPASALSSAEMYSRGVPVPVVFGSMPSNFQPNAADYGATSPFGFGPSTRTLPVNYEVGGR